jgi:hypothetical protein
MSYQSAVASLRNALLALRSNRLSITDFCRQWRGQSALLDVLPPRYRQVMEDLLGRLEAGSLFSEESCSFSQDDLLSQLDIWLDKAEHTLPNVGKP